LWFIQEKEGKVDLILTQALAAATICKVIVDMIRGIADIPSWLSPVLALTFGVVAAVLLRVASGDALASDSIAQAVLAGVLAAGSAVGVTELQRRTS
jgi:hypothetical protein